MSATARKVEKLSVAREKAAHRVAELASEEARLAESFDDPGDAGKVIAARRAVEDAKQERDLLAVALGAAEKAHAEAVAQEAARETEALHGRLRSEAVAFRESLTADLVAFGKKLAAHEALVDSLPPNERFKFWPATYAENASKVLAAGAKTVRQFDLRLLIANP